MIVIERLKRLADTGIRFDDNAASAEFYSIIASLEAAKAKLTANRQPVTRSEQYAHPRGWNDALEFVDRVFAEVPVQTAEEIADMLAKTGMD